MKYTQLNALIRIVTIAALMIPFTSAQAEIVTNGSLTDEIDNFGLPSGWFAGSTTAVKPNSPDVMDQNNNLGVKNHLSFGATPSASPNGGTWVGIATNATLLDESFSQDITFTKGEFYEISWYDANFGYAGRGYTGENQFVAYLNNGTTNEFTFTGTMRALAEGWTLEKFQPFIPTQTDYTLTFKLANPTKSYLSIDGISIKLSDIDVAAPVPEPETYAMLLAGLGLLGFSVRRRKS